MRLLPAVVFSLLTSFALPVTAAPPDDKAVDPREAAKAQIDQALQNVFNAADKNHNLELSRIEFKRAQAGLETTVEQLVQSGLIGRRPFRTKEKRRRTSRRSNLPGPRSTLRSWPKAIT